MALLRRKNLARVSEAAGESEVSLVTGWSMHYSRLGTWGRDIDIGEQKM